MSIAGKDLKTSSPEETFELGRRIGVCLEPGDCVALTGELGAGKTLFVKGAAKGLGCAEEVVSPSFNLMLEYPGRFPIRHLDAYFAARAKAFLEEACAEVFGRDGAALVEWAERIPEFLPAERIEIGLEILGPQSRAVRLRGTGKRGSELLQKIISTLERKEGLCG